LKSQIDPVVVQRLITCGYAVIAVGGRHVQGLGLDADVARKRKLGAEAADPTPAPVIADAEGFCGEAWEHIRDAMARIEPRNAAGYVEQRSIDDDTGTGAKRGEGVQIAVDRSHGRWSPEEIGVC
jgi:hypothetical protein